MNTLCTAFKKKTSVPTMLQLYLQSLMSSSMLPLIDAVQLV